MRQLIDDLPAYPWIGTPGQAFAPVDLAGVVAAVLEDPAATIDSQTFPGVVVTIGGWE